MKTFMNFNDVEGRPFIVEQLNFYELLRDTGFRLFGMDLPRLLEMVKQYQLRCGPTPPTKESIQQVFS